MAHMVDARVFPDPVRIAELLHILSSSWVNQNYDRGLVSRRVWIIIVGRLPVIVHFVATSSPILDAYGHSVRTDVKEI